MGKIKLTKEEQELMKANNIKRQTSVRQALEPIILNISWAEISKEYFGKSRSWLYQKFTGFDGHTSTDFTAEERQLMKDSLFNLAFKIQQCAEKL